MRTIVDEAKTTDPTALEEVEWHSFIESLHVWERRRLLKNELEWHDRFVTGKITLLAIYSEIAEPADYTKAAKEVEKAGQ